MTYRLRAARASLLELTVWAFAAILQGGLCSAQVARDLKYESAPALPDHRQRWALVVGVSTYKYAPPAAQLRYAHRDAEEFARFLQSPRGGAIPADHVRLLTEQSASLASIRAALHAWLPNSAGPQDVVYIYFAGHAVVGDGAQSYFVAHDSDPQNLHATGVSFAEVNKVLTSSLPASLIVLLADACHAGGIGWTSDPSAPSQAAGALEALGSRDRAVLKLLAAGPSERSFEDARWGGGHGVFTYSVLTGLEGQAEREPDGVIRIAELIEFVSRTVPAQTGSRQNPRIAGNFEGALPMAMLPRNTSVKPGEPAAPPASLRVAGEPDTAIYVDGMFSGTIRPNGSLLIPGLATGIHQLSIEERGFPAYEQQVRLQAGPSAIDLRTSPEFALARLQRLIAAGRVMGSGGALEMYRAQGWLAAQRTAARALIAGGLESVAQECVSDYVQSTTNTLKQPMFLAAAAAFEELKSFRPDDPSLEAKRLFCSARAQIAGGEFESAAASLRKSITVDPGFACSYNALGVALGRLGQVRQSREAFEKAMELTPHWALPPFQIAQQLIAANQLVKAAPYLEGAARLNPKAVGLQWSLARLYRVLGRGQDFLRAANATVSINSNYAPIYSELGLYFEAAGDAGRAARAYETYLLLAPNYPDSDGIRKRALSLRR